ncbi:MAG TPA: outer membrane lipoprotein-sorting protein [Terriglobia bacterium]|nr:outer membrane lipoprotein-sorting protein [Terriglobia bacterium]
MTLSRAALLILALGPSAAASFPRIHRRRMSPDLAEILSHMNETSKRLKTLSADLEYTKVTVVVDDKSTERGQIFYAKGKSPQMLIDFKQPDPKTILMKRNRAEIYLPKINQVDEYNLEKHSELVQQFLLLGFGTEAGELEKAYTVKLTGEEDIGGNTTAVLELTPRKESVAAQLAKVQLWISEESWLPVQQKFIEPSGDYLLTRYTAVKVDRELPSSTFEIHAAEGAKRVKH